MFCPKLPCDKSCIEHFVADVFLMQLTQLLTVSLVLDMSFCFSSIKCVRLYLRSVHQLPSFLMCTTSSFKHRRNLDLLP